MQLEIWDKKYLDDLEKLAEIERLALRSGFKRNFAEAISKISNRRGLLDETVVALKTIDYETPLKIFKKMTKDPYSFYQKNKRIINAQGKLLTFGSLSLSYSFCSPYKVVRDIIYDSEMIKNYVEFMKETSDKDFSLKEMEEEAYVIQNFREEEEIETRLRSFKQDLRGNKVPENLLEKLLKKVEFEKREFGGGYNNLAFLSSITKESLMDSFYIFFGSKRGSEFVEEWKNPQNHKKLEEEFEYLVYNNPYINPRLVDKSLKDFMSEEHIKRAERFLKEDKGKGLRKNPNGFEFI